MGRGQVIANVDDLLIIARTRKIIVPALNQVNKRTIIMRLYKRAASISNKIVKQEFEKVEVLIARTEDRKLK